VAPAEHEEQGSLLVIQLEGPPTIEMSDLTVVEHDRIVGID
jgi:hypothetical protein